MIKKLGEYRGYTVWRQVTTDFDGLLSEPELAFPLATTFEEAKKIIDWNISLDTPEEGDDLSLDDLAAFADELEAERKRKARGE